MGYEPMLPLRLGAAAGAACKSQENADASATVIKNVNFFQSAFLDIIATYITVLNISMETGGFNLSTDVCIQTVAF